ncbi:MAG: acyl-CoA reductase [Bacteroidetes bacterium]|nr:acyl-CoA reductase [Bacteroidota bacterium]
MELPKRIKAFVQLGAFLRSFSQGDSSSEFGQQLHEIVLNDHIYNPWFTEKNVKQAIEAIANSLLPEKIEKWVSRYPNLQNQKSIKRIGVITAGNIPLVGFHDFITVLLSGNTFIGKLSSKDNRLLKFIAEYLISIDSEFKQHIYFTENKLENFDAVIATGSNNTARYFEYYFGKYPHIIRKNRSSVAVLNGKESEEEILQLANDFFSYFGLGCRNVSKIFLPKDYCFDLFFENIEHYSFLYSHNKYANNYDYNKSVYLMNQIQHFDNGFVIVKEDEGLSSPIGVIYFQYYDDINKVKEYIQLNSDQIQCVVSKSGLVEDAIPFGNAQQPELWDYADNVDTMKFLLNL